MDELPHARIARRGDGFESCWRRRQPGMVPGVWFGSIAPTVMISARVLPFTLGVSALLWLFIDEILRPSESVRARWNAEGLTLEHRSTHVWRWSDIDAMGVTDRALRFEVRGKVVEVPAPCDQAARDRLLAAFDAHLRQAPPPEVAQLPVRWSGGASELKASLRLRGGAPPSERPFRDRFAVALLATVGLGGSGLTGVAWAVAVFATAAGGWESWPTLASVGGFALMLLAAVLVCTGWGVDVLRRRRLGEVRLGPHKLTLHAVDCQPTSVLWERIEAIVFDDVSLTITSDGRATVFDLSGEPPGRVHALGAELTERWQRVQQATDTVEQADARRAQLARLVGSAR